MSKHGESGVGLNRKGERHLERESEFTSQVEAQFDGLVGPTHHYGGLSPGNVASGRNRGRISNPREAALQGLAKMKAVMEWGFPQGWLPPLARPHWRAWHALGFQGSRAQILEDVAKCDPALLGAGWSASSMWAANAATFIPACDNPTGKAHIIPANLQATFHRSLEAEDMSQLLRYVFPEKAGFVHHSPLPAQAWFQDEGAANHTRLAPTSGSAGLHLFAYGKDLSGVDAANATAAESKTTTATSLSGNTNSKFPARQTLAASQAVARLSGLPSERVLYLRQNPKAIEAGVFHNDVIAVGQGAYWLVHENAYVGGSSDIARVEQCYRKLYGSEIVTLKVGRRRLSMQDAVSSYLFNSQLLLQPKGPPWLLCATECQENPKTRRILREWIDEGYLSRVEFMNLRQSMRNGGGPACLRLRTLLTQIQWKSVPSKLRLTQDTYDWLEAWIKRHYRDRLAPDDLRDQGLAQEVETAFSELQGFLCLPGLYTF